MSQTAPSLLEVRGLRKSYEGRSVLDDVSLKVDRGEAVALVGESGSGKSTLARLLVRLSAPDAGELRLDGSDVLRTEPREATLAFRSQVQMVFQDPFSSLNPVHSVRQHLVRPLLRHGIAATAKDADDQAAGLLSLVGLEPADRFIDALPVELSGGQRQRVAIARALAVRPQLLVADEPTSMLDASVRMGVLELLDRLVRARGIGLLLITHDLATARLLCDRVLVLHAGRIVEEGPSEAVLSSPEHPYTRSLLAALPRGVARVAPPARARRAAAPHRGCTFEPRCPLAVDACRAAVPPLATLTHGRSVRCFVRSSNQTRDTDDRVAFS